MKIQTYQIFFCLVLFAHLSSKPNEAADFSHTQQIVVPPSYIPRGANAPGTNDSLPVPNPLGVNGNIFSIPNIPVNTIPYTDINSLSSSSSAPLEIAGSLSRIQSRVHSLVNAGQLSEAENTARAGLKVYPNNSILKNQFATITASEAQAYLQAQNYDLAAKKARESLVANFSNKTARSVIAKVLRAQGFNPNLAESHAIIGNMLANDVRLLEASVEYKLSLEIKPNAAAHIGLGNIAMSKGQLTEAGRHFQRALSIDPNSALAYRQRGTLRYMSHDIIGANSDFGKAVALNPNDPLANESLINLWKQQVAINPNSANSHLGLARAYLQTHDLEAARNEYKNVVAIDPNHPALPAARASFKMTLARQEADQSVQAAKTLDSQGALNEAHQKMLEALTYCPSDPQILLYHGQICEKLGLSTEAHDAYMSALKANPNNFEAAARLKKLSNSIPAVATPGILSPPPQFQTSPPPLAPPRNVYPLPNENLQDAPLKSPLAPKTQSRLQAPFGNAYYDATESVYIGDPAQVTMLGNFGSCVRALMMAQKQFLQSPRNNQYANNYTNNYPNNYTDSETLSNTQNNWF